MFHTSIINLRINRERVAYIDRTLPSLQELAVKLQNDINISTSKIRNDADMIHGKGKHGDPTAHLALTEVLPDVQELQEDILKLTIERRRRAAWIEEAETALNLLNENERAIVLLRDVESRAWEDVADMIADQDNRYISTTTCRKRYARAMVKISRFFDACDSPDDIKKNDYTASGQMPDP